MPNMQAMDSESASMHLPKIFSIPIPLSEKRETDLRSALVAKTMHQAQHKPRVALAMFKKRAKQLNGSSLGATQQDLKLIRIIERMPRTTPQE
jgi:hypothetical protein